MLDAILPDYPVIVIFDYKESRVYLLGIPLANPLQSNDFVSPEEDEKNMWDWFHGKSLWSMLAKAFQVRNRLAEGHVPSFTYSSCKRPVSCIIHCFWFTADYNRTFFLKVGILRSSVCRTNGTWHCLQASPSSMDGFRSLRNCDASSLSLRWIWAIHRPETYGWFRERFLYGKHHWPSLSWVEDFTTQAG